MNNIINDNNQNYFTITALEDNFQIRVSGSNSNTVQYSLNSIEWFDLPTPTINTDEKIYFKGNLEVGDSQEAYSFSTEQRFNLSGNVMSMLFGDEAEGKTDLTGYDTCFMSMFSNCAGLEKVSKNFLPATTLAENCYDSMFSNCTSLVNAPELPATTLADSCYVGMFYNCTSLVNTPELPATVLANYCYESMFEGCTSLVQAPELPATTLAEGCYGYMFQDCTSLNYIKMLATDISADMCLDYWVNNVSETGTFVKSKDATWNVTGISGIPTGWNVLDIENYLTIEALEDNLTVSLSINPCQYSLNGTYWNELQADEQTPSINSGEKIYFKGQLSPTTMNGIGTFTVSKRFNLSGNVMSMLFGDETQGKTDLTGYDTCFTQLFMNSPVVNVSANFLPATTLAESCYESMFKDCTLLETTPELPAKKLKPYCYSNMFNSCINLKNYPDLHHVQELSNYSLYFTFYNTNLNNIFLDDHIISNVPLQGAFAGTKIINFSKQLNFSGVKSYYEMFKDCTSLTTAPTLPATILKSQCYAHMFEGCTSLVIAPILPAITLTHSCYAHMFEGCTSLVTAPELPATTLAAYCYQQMFADCTSLTNITALPASTLSPYCYNSMFAGCTSLVQTPELSATTLVDGCYKNMFKDCTSLIKAPILPAITLAPNCYAYMFAGCTSLVQTPKLPATTLTHSCYAHMFEGCTSLVQAPALSATTLDEHCCDSMLYGCASLTQEIQFQQNLTLKDYCFYNMYYGTEVEPQFQYIDFSKNTSLQGLFAGTKITDFIAPELSATNLTRECYYEMFKDCTSLVNAPELPATTLKSQCYAYMFEGCTSLTTAPALPATTLVDGCYGGMFDGCTSLNHIEMLATDISANGCLSEWVNRVSETGTFVKSVYNTLIETGVNGIPTGWGIINDGNNPYLTITALEDGLTVLLPDNPCEYSLNGTEWNELSANTATPAINSGKKIYFKADGLTPNLKDVIETFTVSKRFNLSGNVMSMIFGDEAQGKTDLTGYDKCFAQLFMNSPVVNVSANFLPATTLVYSCYAYMFSGCESLVQAPELPATTLVNSCYEYMFDGCTSLVQAPELPATTLAASCYQGMFMNCKSLLDSPQLPVTTLSPYCYQNMFSGCESLVQAPELPATTLKSQCYAYMFEGCTSLEVISNLSTPTNFDYINSIMKGSYLRMFKGCKNLKYVKLLIGDIISIADFAEWLDGVSPTGTFVKSIYATWNNDTYIPKGWTVKYSI